MTTKKIIVQNTCKYCGDKFRSKEQNNNYLCRECYEFMKRYWK